MNELLGTIRSVCKSLTKARHRAIQRRLYQISGVLLRKLESHEEPDPPARRRASRRALKDLVESAFARRILSTCAGLRLTQGEIARRCKVSKASGHFRTTLAALVKTGAILKEGKLYYEIPGKLKD